MKKLLTFLFALLLTVGLQACGFGGGSELVIGEKAVTIRASHAFVYDCSSGELVTHGTGHVHPASLTKLLTCLTALDVMEPDTVITPGEEVYLPGEGSSSAYIRPHHALTLEMLIEAMLLPSGNDAAYAAAAACGRVMAGDDTLPYTDAVDVFVDGMNAYAERLGCTDSRFTVPDGYAGYENYSTAADMAKIAEAASENGIILKYAGLHTDDVIYASGHTNTWTNTNLQLDPASPYFSEHVIGLKTGSLPGNYCLITLYDDGETRVIAGIFGSPTDDGRYEDCGKVLEAMRK